MARPEASAESANYLGIDFLDETAFERGRQFLDRTLATLGGFNGYYGPGIPGTGEVKVDLKSALRERMFFSVQAGSLVQCYIEGVSSDLAVETRSQDHLFGVGVTELESAEIRFTPDSGYGTTKAVICGKLETPNPDNIAERGYHAIRRIYTVLELSSLNLAVIDRDSLSEA